MGLEDGRQILGGQRANGDSHLACVSRFVFSASCARFEPQKPFPVSRWPDLPDHLWATGPCQSASLRENAGTCSHRTNCSRSCISSNNVRVFCSVRSSGHCSWPRPLFHRAMLISQSAGIPYCNNSRVLTEHCDFWKCGELDRCYRRYCSISLEC